MYRFTGFSNKANLALNSAIITAQGLGHTYVGTEHLLAGLLKDTASVAGIVLIGRNIRFQPYCDKLSKNVGAGIPTELTNADITPRLKKVIENALALGSAEKLNSGTEHLLTALLRDQKSVACRLLNEMGASPALLYSDLTRSLGSSESAGLRSTAAKEAVGSKEKGMLSKYSVCLTDKAKAGKIDPVACRENEIERVIRILCRRNKNNPCLIGEPGVGKTAIAEGLALKIANGDVPEPLLGKEVYSLELTGMVAGAKYRGDFEERIKGVINEVIAADNIIVFIDEIHNLIGAGSAEGAVDAANILKPVLARGELHLIGATTTAEYRKNIEKDAALERRFQQVFVEQPTKEQTLQILEVLRPRYEKHHSCKISDSALKAAVELSVRYIGDRFLPDKAIDLIDEASAMMSIKGCSCRGEKERLESELTKAENDKADAFIGGELKKAQEFATREREIRCKLDELSERGNTFLCVNGGNMPEVTSAEIATVVSEWTKIPVTTLSGSEKQRLSGLENRLMAHVRGQSEAVKTVAMAIKRSRLGLKSPNRPTGVFIFCGPTGVGKTELAKAVAEEVFSTSDALIRVDMSEYSEAHSVSRLIGSPPGYVGFEDGGILTSKLRSRPYSALLFDEIEKAHPDVFNTLLQMLDEGFITASDGRRVDCRNSVIIMTSNAGEKYIGEKNISLGFTENSQNSSDAAVNGVMKELKNVFSSEFLNRVDAAVVFKRLTLDDLTEIAAKKLNETAALASASGVTLCYDDNVASYIAAKAQQQKNGARPIQRIITAEIENVLSEYMLSDGEKDGLLFAINEQSLEQDALVINRYNVVIDEEKLKIIPEYKKQ